MLLLEGITCRREHQEARIQTLAVPKLGSRNHLQKPHLILEENHRNEEE